MKPKSFLTTTGIVVGWGLLVVLSVRLVEGSFGLWRDNLEKLHQAQEVLSRLEGWLQVEQEVSARRDEVLGPFAHSAGSDVSWVSLQGLQEVAKEKGITVTELRPSRLPGQAGQPPLLRLDAKLEGGLKEMTDLLQRLPSAMPGVRLENLQFVPKQGEGRIQTLLQLSLPEGERPR